MAVTLRDVAKKAKTDITSVSNTLRHSPRALELTEATRRRIFSAARELGYTRNAFAAAMRTGENKTIAVILSVDTTRDNIFTNQALFSILQKAAILSYGISVYTDSEIKVTVDSIVSHQIKKVVVLGMEDSNKKFFQELVEKRRLEVVSIMEPMPSPIKTLDFDKFGGAQLVVEFLYKLGHRRIACLGSASEESNLMGRLAGYRAGLAKFGLEQSSDGLAVLGEGAVFDNFLDGIPSMPPERRPDAIFATEDNLAVSAESVLLSRGIEIPEDISIVGFGNYAGFNAFSPITTVTGDFTLLGAAALNILLGEAPSGLVINAVGNPVLPMRIFERDSVMDKNRGAPKHIRRRNLIERFYQHAKVEHD